MAQLFADWHAAILICRGFLMHPDVTFFSPKKVTSAPPPAGGELRGIFTYKRALGSYLNA
jgi:hypothetical protein